MNYEISYPTPIEKIDSIYDNIDVFLNLNNGENYTFVVTTPDGLKRIMENEHLPFIKPETPFAIVEKITKNNIQQLINEFLKGNDIFLKIYGSDLF